MKPGTLLVFGAALLCAPLLQAQDCNAFETPIFAGQTIHAGDAIVSNTGVELLIRLEARPPWLIKEVHIFAGLGPLPLNGGGNPPPGQFPYSAYFHDPVPEYLRVIPLADLGAGCDDVLNVAIHTVMVQLDADGRVVEDETGWAFGDKTWRGSRWGWYFCYTVCCEDGCPNATLDLTITPLQRDQPATFTVETVNPGESVYFFATCGLLQCDEGSLLPVNRFGGLRLDITRALYLGRAVAGAGGSADLNLVVPTDAPVGRSVLFQAAVARGMASEKSNVVAMTILP